ncbi:MAG: hypothetical protein Tsb009_01670 [Planctomycetaceae bacterium]
MKLEETSGVEKLSLEAVGPCEPGQRVTPAALSIGSQVRKEIASRLPFFKFPGLEHVRIPLFPSPRVK